MGSLELPFYSSMLDVKMLVGDGLGPEYSQHSSKVLGVEGGQFVEVAFSHPPVF